MKKMTQSALALSLVGIFGLAIPACAHEGEHHAHTTISADKVTQAKADLRNLWVGHVFWVRNVVLETQSGNAEAAKAAENEVVANAKQIAAAIEPFYGKEASAKLFDLLAAHYGAVKSYLTATSAKSKSKQEAALASLTSNANDIAVFLSGANPNLPADTVRNLFLAHDGHHVQEINQLQARQYAAEAKTWEEMKSHMYVLADALADAIAKQFPAKFA
jgi:hypothetical protein